MSSRVHFRSPPVFNRHVPLYVRSSKPNTISCDTIQVNCERSLLTQNDFFCHRANYSDCCSYYSNRGKSDEVIQKATMPALTTFNVVHFLALKIWLMRSKRIIKMAFQRYVGCASVKAVSVFFVTFFSSLDFTPRTLPMNVFLSSVFPVLICFGRHCLYVYVLLREALYFSKINLCSVNASDYYGLLSFIIPTPPLSPGNVRGNLVL